jgi:hypothetical protein
MSLLLFASTAGLLGGAVAWLTSWRRLSRTLHLQGLERLAHSDSLKKAERAAGRALASGIEELEQLPIIQETLHDLPSLMPQPPIPAIETIPINPLDKIEEIAPAVVTPPPPVTANRSQKYANSFLHTRPRRSQSASR